MPQLLYYLYHSYIIPMPINGGMTNVDYNKWWDAIPPYPPPTSTTVCMSNCNNILLKLLQILLLWNNQDEQTIIKTHWTIGLNLLWNVC